MKQKSKKSEKKTTSYFSIFLAVGIVAILVITTFIVLFSGSPTNNTPGYTADVSYKNVKDESDNPRINWTMIFTNVPSSGLGAWSELEWKIKRSNGKTSEKQPFLVVNSAKWSVMDAGNDNTLGQEDKITIRSDYFNPDVLINHGDVFMIYEKESGDKLMEVKLY